MTATITRTDHWQAFDEAARRLEGRYESAALILFARERREITASIEAAISTKALPDFDQQARNAVEFPKIEALLLLALAKYQQGGEYFEAWLTKFRPLVRRSVNTAVQRLKETVGISFSLANPRVQQVIAERTARLVTNVTATTQGAIRDAISVGRLQGMGVREIARHIRDTTFGEVTKTRAITIARTETVGALNGGEHEMAVASGVLQSKTWLTQKDGRVRDSHAALDEQTVPLNAPFANGLQYPHQPGAPASEVINCRCTVLYSDLPAP